MADRTARWQSDTEHLKAKRLTRDPDQAISASLLRKPGALRLSEHIATDGLRVFARAAASACPTSIGWVPRSDAPAGTAIS